MISCYTIKEKISSRDYLKKCGLSNNYIYKLSQVKAIYNNQGVKKLDDILEYGEKIYIDYSLLEKNNSCIKKDALNKKIKILYEDSEIIAIYKERGILIHSDGNEKNTLLDDVNAYLYKNGDDSYVRPLHRLDLETCGVVLFSKNVFAHAFISKLLEEGKVYKEYYALVKGVLEKDGIIDIGIGKDRHNSKKSVAIKSGKSAYTEYVIKKTYNNKTLLKIVIKTGRTHQIRVHMAYIKHPIIGDCLYGENDKNHLMLLCHKMSFNLFDKKLEVASGINDMENF